MIIHIHPKKKKANDNSHIYKSKQIKQWLFNFKKTRKNVRIYI